MGRRFLLITKLWLRDAKKALMTMMTHASGFAALCVMVLLILDFGFQLDQVNRLLFAQLHLYLLGFFFVDVVLRFLFLPNRWTYFLRNPTDLFVFYPVLNMYALLPSYATYFLAQMALGLIMIGRFKHLNLVFLSLKVRPTQLFILGFLFVIFTGSLMLSLPIAVTGQAPVPYVDALFTAFSAVCVTGLSVNTIGTVFSPFGQGVILMLIQVGGLGIMTFSVLLAYLLQQKISHSFSRAYQETFSTFNIKDTFRTILFIVRFTFFFELIGIVILFFGWYGQFETLSQTFFYAVFHAISAFCNAGFSLFSDSVVGYAGNPIIIFGLSLLIIVGGLGFPVLYNLNQNLHLKFSFKRLKLQTKLTLWVTGGLIIFGTAMIFFAEYQRALAGASLQDKFLMAFFQSVSARTAGFNSMDLNLLHPGTIVMMMGLMIVGAAPGSTGGGIKTTTFGLLLISFWHTLRSSNRIDVARRTVRAQNVTKALALMILGVLLILLFFYILLFTESVPFLPLLFETVSAFGTVGFSLGVTSQLSNVGKVIIMIVMFIGRLGPLTVAVALARPTPEANYAYPEEDVMIG